MWEIVPQSIYSYSDLDHLVDPILGDIETGQCQYISSPFIASHHTHLLYPELLFSSSRYSMELLFYSSRYPADTSWTFPSIIKERECGYPSHQQIPTFCLHIYSSHSCLRLTWQMSLSRELSVDSQVTCCGENMFEESEDYILSQVTSEILNRVNNTKGEER